MNIFVGDVILRFDAKDGLQAALVNALKQYDLPAVYGQKGSAQYRSIGMTTALYTWILVMRRRDRFARHSLTICQGLPPSPKTSTIAGRLQFLWQIHGNSTCCLTYFLDQNRCPFFSLVLYSSQVDERLQKYKALGYVAILQKTYYVIRVSIHSYIIK